MNTTIFYGSRTENLLFQPKMKIYFVFRKSRAKTPESSNLGTICFILSYQKEKSTKQTTKISIEKKFWDAKNQTFIGRQNQHLNDLVTSIRQKFVGYESALNLIGKTVNVQTLLDLYYGKITLDGKSESKQAQIKLSKVMKDYLELQIKKHEKGKKEFATVINHQKYFKNILSYLHDRFQLQDLLIEKIDTLFLNDFENYLLIDREFKQNYVSKHLVFVKTLIRFAVDNKYILSNQLQNHRCKWDNKQIPIALTFEEYQHLKNFQFDQERLTRIQDVFIFCCETSFHYKDYVMLDDSHFYIDEDGDWWIVKQREKTDILQRVPLTKTAMQILRKYGKISLMPRLSNVEFNRSLKELAEIAGINKVLTFKVARKTFIEQNYNTKGIRSEIIAEIVGWTSSRPLKTYASIHNKTLKDALK